MSSLAVVEPEDRACALLTTKLPKPKRKYTRKQAPELQSSDQPPAKPKPKRVLSDKQKECLAKGREQRLEKLKSVSTKNK
jgi:hypothetical protein